jgi:hypothetical protein
MPLVGVMAAPDAWPSLPRTRREAKAVGSVHYYDPRRACIHGHTAPRRTSNGCCVVCQRQMTQGKPLARMMED